MVFKQLNYKYKKVRCSEKLKLSKGMIKDRKTSHILTFP